MTVDQLAAIEARAQAATEGPWKASDFGYSGQEEPSSIIIHQGAFNWLAIDKGEYVAAMPAWDSQEGSDAEFIAHARTDVPALLALVREQQAALALIANQVNAAEMLCRMNERDPELASVPSAAIRAVLTELNP